MYCYTLFTILFYTVPPVVVVGHTNIVQVINSTVVIQFSIENAAPPVEVEEIHWTFTTQSGVNTNTTVTGLLSTDHGQQEMDHEQQESGYSGEYSSNYTDEEQKPTTTTEWVLSLDRLTLAIPRAQLSNIGTYTITASNPAGVSTGSVHLDIHGNSVQVVT